MKTLKDSIILLIVLAAGFQVLAGPIHTKGENEAFMDGATYGMWYAEHVVKDRIGLHFPIKPLPKGFKAEWGDFLRANSDTFKYQP